MGAPRGNKNAEGGRGGGGRPTSGRQWIQDNFLEQLLSQEIDVAELVARIKSGKFYLGESILYQALVLNKTEITVKLIDKLFSDRRPLKPLFDTPLSETEKVELFESLDRAFDEFPALGYKPHRRRLTDGKDKRDTTAVKRSRVRKPTKAG